ncbi:MAG TPA: esterase, partial [Anaerolineae bacterium]|nr:esterase [Anaerolineae bacterium]
MPIFAPHKMYRTDYTRCVSSDPETQCPEHAIQVYENATEPQRRYWLGFIEFDDQGQLFDRRQMEAVLEDLARQPGELLIVVFVHGWKHSAAPGDDNIAGFRQALGDLAEMEAVGSENPRQVAGIYIGWRGESITVPVIKELTFWDRKNTSHKVGNGGVTEVFNRIDLIRRMKNGTAENQAGPTRLAIVGHSFGGAVVFSAVDEILSDRFIASLR